jgi:hypothetical protein
MAHPLALTKINNRTLNARRILDQCGQRRSAVQLLAPPIDLCFHEESACVACIIARVTDEGSGADRTSPPSRSGGGRRTRLRSICGHLTEEMTERYSSVAQA